MTDWEYYATPLAFTRYLYWAMAKRGTPITGRCFEPCVGDGAIVAASTMPMHIPGVAPDTRRWQTNDLDERWPANQHGDAAMTSVWHHKDVRDVTDWTVTNPPFTPALKIIDQALRFSTVGVAMHLRASIHEVLKTGIRRTWMREHTPTGILWLPRFAYQRSKTTGKWTTDSVCACWVIWIKAINTQQFIDYAPEWVIDELDGGTTLYRAEMDRIMADRPPVREGTATFAGEIP
jgi:predicted RNA methylase